MTDWIGWVTTSKSCNNKKESDSATETVWTDSHRNAERSRCCHHSRVRSSYRTRLRGIDEARARERVLVSWNLPRGRAADPDRRDVAVRRVARCGRRRVRGSARRRWSDEAHDEAGVPRQGWP